MKDSHTIQLQLMNNRIGSTLLIIIVLSISSVAQGNANKGRSSSLWNRCADAFNKLTLIFRPIPRTPEEEADYQRKLKIAANLQAQHGYDYHVAIVYAENILKKLKAKETEGWKIVEGITADAISSDLSKGKLPGKIEERYKNLKRPMVLMNVGPFVLEIDVSKLDGLVFARALRGDISHEAPRIPSKNRGSFFYSYPVRFEEIKDNPLNYIQQNPEQFDHQMKRYGTENKSEGKGAISFSSAQDLLDGSSALFYFSETREWIVWSTDNSKEFKGVDVRWVHDGQGLHFLPPSQ